jgi:exopolysaccharide production protein ExoZ
MPSLNIKGCEVARPQIQSIQVFRGLAAFAVVAHHAALSTEAFVGVMPAVISALFGFGLLGVDFFFVLSGFIIMFAHMDDDQRQGPTVKRYVFKRLTRIFPAYWPIGLGLIVLYVAMPGLSAGAGREYSVLSSVLLVPANAAPALSVAWTLVHELMFYGVFLLFFLSRRWLVGGLLTWALLIIWTDHWTEPVGWLRYPTSLLNIEFMLGVGAAWLARTLIDKGKGAAIAILGSCIVIAALWLMWSEKSAYLRLLMALGLALVIVGFAVREQVAGARWPVFLLMLGNSSYSIYLVHNPLLSITQRVAQQMALTWPAAMLWGVVLSLLAGWVYFRLVEQPALRFFQSRLNLK